MWPDLQRSALLNGLRGVITFQRAGGIGRGFNFVISDMVLRKQKSYKKLVRSCVGISISI